MRVDKEIMGDNIDPYTDFFSIFVLPLNHFVVDVSLLSVLVAQGASINRRDFNQSDRNGNKVDRYRYIRTDLCNMDPAPGGTHSLLI